ncbi:unnamed protein product [Bemisia tabaci]|uniref:Protein eyes shut homolog n=1 Tax=Bemisia tabaci TaxID=7038 RepID=A0A9P0AEA5_BEMTA|nr:unnamed protein product [Bemisia tabaci]
MLHCKKHVFRLTALIHSLHKTFPDLLSGDTTYSIPDFKFSYETTTDFWSEDTTLTDGPTTQQPFSEFNTTFYAGTTLSTLSSTDFHRTPSTLGLDDDRFRTQRSLTTEDADRWYSHSTEPNEIGPALYPTKFLPETETPPPSDVTSEDELTTIEPTLSTKKEAPATLGPPMFPDCSKWPCLNGGSCFYSEKGPKCACRFGWEGELCQERQGVQTPALTGRSYLIHRLSNDTGAVIGVDIRTLAPTGLILYAAISPHLYMSTYLQDGLLKFQFSCGVQTMVFSEVKLHINNGYNINIMAIIEMGSTIEDLGKCTASLLVNNTLKMSGDQMTALTIKQSSENLLYLGGLPDYLQPQIDIPVKTGITGCMRALQIDAVEVDIYNDAVEGEQITECSSLACLSNPCHGTATCVEFADTWNCLCPNGYVGLTCEQSVCLNNPCHFGATCVQYPGSGFLCLCPLGKHGLFCEHDLEVGQPSFFSSVNGLSSFIAYPLPTAIHNSFELRFRFVAEDADQISLMLFIGQDHMHDAMTDHFAVSFIKGYIALTWNLGSGPRRIFMSQPINVKAHLQQAHTVRLGRLGQRAWLTVDGLGNVTGTSPGRLTQLNTKPIIFIGGHNSENFSILPHDLPLHRGFLGCIFDVQLRAGRISLNLQKTRAAIGRGVGQCATTPCYSTTCHNGGACLNQGATFTCLCPDGWFGPLCSHRYNLCDFTRHNCSSGSTCVPLIEHYECDCPIGRSGKFCEKEEQLSDVSFSGTRSFLSIAQQELHLLETTLEFELKPEKERGLIMFSRNSKHNSFFAISLQGGVLELRLLTQGGSNGGEIIVVRSGRILGMNAWHKIQMSRFGRRVQLAVDGTSNSATLLTGQVLLATDSLLSIGGVSDLSELPNGAMAGLPIPFTGCLRKLMINDKRIQLDERTILVGRNVADCDGTACGGDICQHNGSCWLDISLQAHCNCPQEYTGEHCETQLSCMEVKCQNKGRCQKDEDSEVPRCHCPLGWTGSYCERESAVGAPRFQGDGYLIVDKTASGFKRRGLSERSKRNELEFVYVNFSTAQPEAMILWSSQESELIGIGVESGLLKLVWSWRGEEPSTTVVVPRTVVADGTWHDVAVSITAANITVVADQKATLVFNHHQERLIATDGIFYLGEPSSFHSHSHSCRISGLYLRNSFLIKITGKKTHWI